MPSSTGPGSTRLTRGLLIVRWLFWFTVLGPGALVAMFGSSIGWMIGTAIGGAIRFVIRRWAGSPFGPSELSRRDRASTEML
jgi:hypothetical protein